MVLCASDDLPSKGPSSGVLVGELLLSIEAGMSGVREATWAANVSPKGAALREPVIDSDVRAQEEPSRGKLSIVS